VSQGAETPGDERTSSLAETQDASQRNQRTLMKIDRREAIDVERPCWLSDIRQLTTGHYHYQC
jgi:hypothetical protein